MEAGGESGYIAEANEAAELGDSAVEHVAVIFDTRDGCREGCADVKIRYGHARVDKVRGKRELYTTRLLFILASLAGGPALGNIARVNLDDTSDQPLSDMEEFRQLGDLCDILL